MGSSRLPGKVLKKILDKSILEIHLDRLSSSNEISGIVVATTTEPADDKICEYLKKRNIDFFRGSEHDVLDRYYQTAVKYQPEIILRVTSDCPLIDPKLVDQLVLEMKSKRPDYISNTLIERFPDGQDIEVFTFEALEKAWKEATKGSEREHVTPYIKYNSDFYGKNRFRAKNYDCDEDYSKIRMTVDEPEDLLVIKKLISALGTNAAWEEYCNFMIEHNIDKINADIIRNEGYLRSIENESE